MAASQLPGTSCRPDMERISSRHLARRQERLSYTQPLEGKAHVSQVCAKLNGSHHCLSSLIGIGEIILLPLDVLKIKRQTNPEAFKGRGVFKILAEERSSLYRGWGWTAARNAPGSFAVSVTPPCLSPRGSNMILTGVLSSSLVDLPS